MDKLKQLFENAGLPTNFNEKAQTLFEAAVNEAADSRIAAEVKKIQESSEKKLDEAKQAWIKESDEDVEKFLEAVVNEWATKNTAALVGSIKVGIAENILTKFKGVLEAEGIEMPDEKEKAIKEAEDKEEELKEEIEDLKKEIEESRKQIISFTKSSILSEATKGLSAVSASRIKKLAENLTFKSPRQFATAVATLTEGVANKKLKIKEEVADLFPATKDNSDSSGVEKNKATADKENQVTEDAGPEAASKYPATTDNSNSSGSDKNKSAVEPNDAVNEDNKYFDDEDGQADKKVEEKKKTNEDVGVDNEVKDKVDNTDNPQGKDNNVNESLEDIINKALHGSALNG